MYLWDIHELVRDLKNNSIASWKVKLYYILSPLLSIFNGLFFGTLLFSHHVVEYSFKGWLSNPTSDLHTYDYWGSGLTILTIVIAFGGMYLCYRENKKGDDKNFWERMACLSFPINFHITLYAIMVLIIVGFIAYIFLQNHVASFKQTVWPTDQEINSALDRINKCNPLLNVTVKTVKTKSVIPKILKSPRALASLPLITLRIKYFLKSLRAMILMAYPVLSMLPSFLSFLHYFIVRKMIKEVAQNPESLQLPSEKPLE